MLALAIPDLEVNREAGLDALAGGAVATDEVMRRVELGVPFRRAYRDVAAALKRGETFPTPSVTRLIARRRSTGGLGRLDLRAAWRRWERCRRWNERERTRFHRAMDRLRGTRRR